MKLVDYNKSLPGSENAVVNRAGNVQLFLPLH